MAELTTQAYEQIVESYAKEKTNFLFHNQGNVHALIVFKSIFRNAVSRVRIAAESLTNPEVANNQEYLTALQVFLDRPETQLQILLSDAPQKPFEYDLFRMLRSHEAYREGRVEIRDGKGRNFRRNGLVCHFCTADSRMYRIETDITNRKAECNFGDKSTTEFLERIFDEAFRQETKVEW